MTDETPWPIDPDAGMPDEWETALQRIESWNGNPAPAIARADAVMALDRMRWERFIFQTQAERAAREANDAQHRHQEAMRRAASDAADQRTMHRQRLASELDAAAASDRQVTAVDAA